MRLIDVDALKESWDVLSDGKVFDFIEIEEIKNAPTIDAVEVVRCKDCKHRDEEHCPDGLLWCNHFATAMLEYQYCDYGERRDDRI